MALSVGRAGSRLDGRAAPAACRAMTVAGDDRDELPPPGSTAVLTDEGWQVVDYQDPADDWRLLPDGSYEAPDGRTRTWPHDNPAGA